MTSPDTYEIALIGGPRDGETLAYTYQPYFIYQNDDTKTFYELQFGGYLPSQDEHGRYRYLYRGTR